MSMWLFVLLLCVAVVVALAIFVGLIVLVVKAVKHADKADVDGEVQYQEG